MLTLTTKRADSMQYRDTIQFANGVAKIVQLCELQNCDAWKLALRNKCKDHRYYEIVEETLECGFVFQWAWLMAAT